MSEHVIALDPGGRTGWASARMDVDRLELTGTGVLRQDLMARTLAEWQAIEVRGTRNPMPNLEEYYQLVVVPQPTFNVVVAESWRPRRDERGKMDWIEGDPLLSAQHLGQIRFIADLSGATYREYSPMQKPAFTASMPKVLLDLDADSNEQHDKDARMHLWGYFFENWFTATVDPESVVVL